MLSERSQSEKATYCMTPSIRHSGNGKTIDTVKRSLVARGWWGGVRDEQGEHRGFLGK